MTKDYTASMAADVISRPVTPRCSVSDPGKLTNGSFTLASPLQVSATSPLGTAGAGGTLLTYAGPVSHDPVTVGFKQHIDANEPLRTGAYSTTLTFTLSTTTP